MADWLQGPYFYGVYISKVIGGQPVSTDLVARLFLTGFAASAVLGAGIGRCVDNKGRKAGSLAFTFFYALSALSTRSNSLFVLYSGRVAGGIGTSLLFSAPEAWFVAEHKRGGHVGQWLSDAFGLAYLGDAVIAIAAGQLAGAVAAGGGPSAPFTLSLLFLAGGAAVVLATWCENTAATSESGGGSGIMDAWRHMWADPHIMSVGAVQALFEGAMYIFVMQWPPAVIGVLSGRDVPFGKVFSCLMASCMVGSSIFGPITRCWPVEKATGGMLCVAAFAMASAATWSGSLPCVLGSFFVFEVCVGFYFPAVGTLRSKYLPDTHRGVMMTLFQIPLNVLVASVMLTMSGLGLRGSLACSTTALAFGFLAALRLFNSKEAPNAALA